MRPILGAHLVTDDEETVALATDERGWAALCRAITRIHWAVRRSGDQAVGDTGSNRPTAVRRPRPDREGLILLSRDPVFLDRVLRLSGPRDLYAELCPGKERHAVLAAARRLGLPVVATNAVVAAHPEDWQRHRLLRAIHLNTTISALAPATVRPPDRLTA